MSVARLAAYRVLRAVDAGEDLPAALTRHRDRLPDSRDRALVTELTTGVLRWRRALDFEIGHGASREPKELDPEVLSVLRLGAYQLRHLARVPAAAAVSESVRLVRTARKSSAAGLVNAVLRTLSTPSRRQDLPADPGTTGSREDQIRFLGIAGSHPDWLVRRWLKRLGHNTTRRWVTFNNQPAALTLCADTQRHDRTSVAEALLQDGVTTTATRFAHNGLRVVNGNPFRTAAFEAGLFHVQDEASQLVAAFAGIAPGERVLDACAAPGGKTLTLAAGLEGRGWIVAGDRRRGRVQLLRRTLTRMAVARTSVLRLDVTHPLPFGPVFDCVLLDVPCSGLGVIRSDPEIRWRRTPEDLARFPEVQLQMLEQAARTITSSGRLLYATCSTEPEENALVVEAFLRRHYEFEPSRPARETDFPAELLDGNGFLVTRPDAHELEGFFGALLRRR